MRAIAEPRDGGMSSRSNQIPKAGGRASGTTELVCVVDDDQSMRRGLRRLLKSAGYAAETFSSAEDYLAREIFKGPICLVLDVRMPGLKGPGLQEALEKPGACEQIVFLTGHGDVPTATRAMKKGAVDFLTKPFKPGELLKCVERALARSAEQRRVIAEKDEARHLFDLLTPREFEVMQLVITGMLNKQIAGELGRAEKTVKVHRGRVMQKLGITSVAELIKLVQKAGIASAAIHKTKV